MGVFYLIFGVILGTVFSVTTIAATVWCIQITIYKGFWAGSIAGFGVALSQFGWALIAAAVVVYISSYAWEFDWLYRILAVPTLLSMAWSIFGSKKIESISYRGEFSKNSEIFYNTFINAIRMPMRFSGYISLFISVSLQLSPGFKNEGFISGLLIAVGVFIGSMFWWLFFIILAALFGKRVPEPVTLKSLNKLKFLSGMVLLALALICAIPLIPGFS